LDSEYLITGTTPWEADIFSGGKKIAEIRKGKDQAFRLIDKRNSHEWILTNKVHGEIRPFSISIFEQEGGKKEPGREVLTIRDHLFKYRDKIYMLTNHPEGRPWQEYLSGPRYISRLDNFPYTDIAEIDNHTKHRLRRFRGVPVGKATGLGIHDGHRVKVDKELDDIGLFIASASFLIYSAV
jgi:hypothetical protein